MSYRDDDSTMDSQPDNPQDYFHNDYDPPIRSGYSKPSSGNYQSDNPQSYNSDER